MSWTTKQHLLKSKAKEGHQLSPGGPSNRQKNDIDYFVTRYVVPCSVNFKIKWHDYWPRVSLVLALQIKEEYPWVGSLLIYM